MEIQVKLEDLKKNKLFVATPMYGGMAHGLYIKSCLDLQTTMSKYGVEDFTIIRTDSLSKKKTGDRQNKLDFEDISDINYQNSLINEYVERMMPFVDKNDLAELEKINRDVNSRIVHEDTLRNIMWKPVRFEFSNMFSYGEDNKIDFSKLNGLMGLFAPNAQDKCQPKIKS